MRGGLTLVVALLVAAVAAHFLFEDSGYVLIDYRGYLIEMSVPALLLVLLALYAAVRGLAAVLRAPRSVGQLAAERRRRRTGRHLNRGLVLLAEGDWAKGERLLLRAARRSDAPLVHYLMAARAAQHQGFTERRDEWLRIAHAALPDAGKAVLLTQAELQLENGEHRRALATAKRVLDDTPRHPVALSLAARAAAAMSDRDELIALLPRLDRAGLDAGDIERFAAEALDAAFAGPELTSAVLERQWGRLSRELRRVPRLIAIRAAALDRLGRGDDAERDLKAALKRRWDSELVEAYGRLRTADGAKQLKRAEGWLQQRPEDAVLLVTAARLCMTQELWGKARSYLESSIAIDPAPEAYALYGALLDRMGENEQAAIAFRSGLALVDDRAAGVPALEPPAG